MIAVETGEFPSADEAVSAAPPRWSRTRQGRESRKAPHRVSPGAPLSVCSFCACDGSQIPKYSACYLPQEFISGFRFPFFPFIHKPKIVGSSGSLCNPLGLLAAGRRNWVRRRTEKHKHQHPASSRLRLPPLSARTARDARCLRICEAMTTI